jgi:hypothetical protein
LRIASTSRAVIGFVRALSNGDFGRRALINASRAIGAISSFFDFDGGFAFAGLGALPFDPGAADFAFSVGAPFVRSGVAGFPFDFFATRLTFAFWQIPRNRCDDPSLLPSAVPEDMMGKRRSAPSSLVRTASVSEPDPL